MKIDAIEQYDAMKQFNTTRFDIFIAACGFESRGIYIGNMITTPENGKYVIYFSDRKSEVSSNNREYFEKNNYISISNDLSLGCWLKDNISSFSSRGNRPINILIDYSCMTRVMYGDILRVLFLADQCNPINLWFAYSLSKYHTCPPMSFNRNAEPIPGYSYIDSDTSTEKGTALVIGLGCEKNRSEGLIEFIDPIEKVVFLTDKNSNTNFYNDILKVNKQVLASLPEKSIITYHLSDFMQLYSKLYSTCLALREQYRVILAPIGPKPFALASMLVSLSLSGCDVWRVSGGPYDEPQDAKPNGKIVLVKVSLK